MMALKDQSSAFNSIRLSFIRTSMNQVEVEVIDSTELGTAGYVPLPSGGVWSSRPPAARVHGIGRTTLHGILG